VLILKFSLGLRNTYVITEITFFLETFPMRFDTLRLTQPDSTGIYFNWTEEVKNKFSWPKSRSICKFYECSNESLDSGKRCRNIGVSKEVLFHWGSQLNEDEDYSLAISDRIQFVFITLNKTVNCFSSNSESNTVFLNRCFVLTKQTNSSVLELWGGGDYWDICHLVIYIHGGRKSTKRNKK